MAASLCCIGPLLALGLGVSGFAASAWFALWRPYFLSASFGLLALAWYLTYRRSPVACADGQVGATAVSGKAPKIFLWIVTGLAIPAALFPALITAESPTKNSCPSCGAPSSATKDGDCCAPPQSKATAPAAPATERKVMVKAERISLFSVPLVCAAAPEIGCGSKAKPRLAALERDAQIAEAWLNATGTVLAVVGGADSSRESRARAVQTVFEARGEIATELDGEARQRNLDDFLSRDDWYRGTAVDRLSQQEARIIGARLIRRVQARIPLADAKARDLETRIASLFERRFTDRSPDRPKLSGEQKRDELLAIARELLDEREAAIFREALASGIGPQAGEK